MFTERAYPFTLVDTQRRKRTPLTEFRGRKIVLLFLCGCSWCTDFVRQWAQVQRGGALTPKKKTERPPVTVIVYAGSAAELMQLAEQSGLLGTQTVLLPDPLMTVATRYKADPCPRVFVLDARAQVRYVNRGKDDTPRECPAELLVAKTLTALRAEKGG
jgi:hypothetical protein